MANIKVVIAYDGTDYHGFQEQRGTRFVTVQSVLEKCLKRLSGRQIRVIGAGRTDAGVHARGQVINFDPLGWTIPPERVAYALNGVLPRDIVALSSKAVPDSFHARFSAVAKTYRYTVHNAPVPSPFTRLYSLHVPQLLDVESMSKAAVALLGRHDFAPFRALGTPVKSTVRTVHEASVRREGEFIYIDIRADGFLYHMARLIVGTLLRVGLKKIPPSYVADVLAGRNGAKAGPAAPARGLCLEKVEYPPAFS